MKRNDKIIVLFGVFILVVASIGIYFWVPQKVGATTAEADDFLKITGIMQDLPEAITVSDACPFTPLIVTPLAVNYDAEGEQYLAPMLVEKINEVSSAVSRLKEQIGITSYNSLSIDELQEPKALSLDVAKKYWKSSDAALLIKNDQDGYNLGVVATPLASYLSIPVIVTDTLDQDVRTVLDDLDVEYTLICGDLDGYGNYIKFKDINEINDLCIKIVQDKFDDVGYITLTNPLDAMTPEILDKQEILSETGTLKTISVIPQTLLTALSGAFGQTSYTFTIPEDYKYALVKLDFRNLEDPEYVEKFGDCVNFGGNFIGYMRSYAYPAKVDENGNVVEDRFHYERVLYDMGGEEFNVALAGIYVLLKEAKYEITVTAEKLNDSIYPTMKQFSSVAPYLTAYHKGIVYADPNFAFAADDDVKLNGKTLTGDAQPFHNPALIPVENQHVYDNIYRPLTSLISKIKNIEIDELEDLKKECYQNPLYIAIVGDTGMLPQYYYRSPHSDPFNNPKSSAYGTNTPSDFIYGNIDPQMYSLAPYPEDYLENDLYSDFPEAENIVGRITGWDVQDASALITRTIFYNKLLENEIYKEWKENAAVLVGAGTEVQRLPVLNFIHKLLGEDEPMKFPSGEKYFLIKRILNNFEQGGFNGQSAHRGAAQRVGFTNDAINDIKTSGILNRLFFQAFKLKLNQGFQNLDSLKDPNWWKTTLFGDTSTLVIGGQLEQNSNLIVSDSHAIWFEKEAGDIALFSVGGPFYELLSRYIPIKVGSFKIRTPLEMLGAYTVRDVPYTNMGPSLMLVEGCGSGKIDAQPMNTLANAYLHAGVNAYVSPTTFSAFYGALEPRPDITNGVGFGIMGFLKAWMDWKVSGIYPEICFNQFIFEETILDLAQDDVTMGRALRDAKNKFLPEQFDDTYRWQPVLNLPSTLPDDLQEDIKDSQGSSEGSGDNVPVEKYCTVFQLNLLGDPAWNPYEPCNEGK